jgi:hypothetical protein
MMGRDNEKKPKPMPWTYQHHHYHCSCSVTMATATTGTAVAVVVARDEYCQPQPGQPGMGPENEGDEVMTTKDTNDDEG